MESYLSRCARVALSVRSLTPTISMSAPEARDGAEEVAADAAEAVDAYANSHCESLLAVGGSRDVLDPIDPSRAPTLGLDRRTSVRR